ncbi:hypothetical protein [Hyalangium rubrum]|uniref:B box-type domain-containing protein n=1 Tax=Hyalangium rubrum TaxID=3103134 RepID=A0ABU5GXW4_9BACT|nr:hypothetical protein [Hyalangium sp. s54d21]MDY7226020.1 hypothetical protein [Hyalangium sp. s54d21]
MASCARCGTFLCGDCTEVMDEAAHCADCVARLRLHGKPSRRVQGLIGLGIAGILSFPLMCGLPPVFSLVVAALGLWLPTRELDRIRRGEGPLRGMRQAKVARWLAGTNLLMVLLWLGVFLYSWYSGTVD